MSEIPLSDKEKDVEQPHKPEEPPGRIELCCKSIATTICQALFQFVLAIVFLVIGVKYIDECPVQKWIPIYLIVVGAGMLLMFAVTCCWNYYQMRKESIEKTGEEYDTGCCCKWLIMVRYLLIVFMFLFTKAWFIGGTVLVYSVHGKTSTDPNDQSNYCHGTLYWFSFVTLTIVWSVLALVALVVFCGLCVGSCMGASFLENLENSMPWEKKTTRAIKASSET